MLFDPMAFLSNPHGMRYIFELAVAFESSHANVIMHYNLNPSTLTPPHTPAPNPHRYSSMQEYTNCGIMRYTNWWYSGIYGLVVFYIYELVVY